MTTLLETLLRADPSPIAADDVVAFLEQVGGRVAWLPRPVERAVLSGFFADRLGYAFAAGYQRAIRALVPSVAEDGIVSFSVTEAAGNHPKAIESRLEEREGGYLLSGQKRWATLADVASFFLVVAVEGEHEGRKRLRLARVDRQAAGVRVVSMPAPPFVPEVPHAALEFEQAIVTELLEGDGYDRYVKPFRTVEDIHVHASTLGYLFGVARRYTFGEPVLERLAAAVISLGALADLEPSSAETHLALSGALADNARLISDVEPLFQSVADTERERWHRDRHLFGVASQVREKRRQRAWQTIARDRDDS